MSCNLENEKSCFGGYRVIEDYLKIFFFKLGVLYEIGIANGNFTEEMYRVGCSNVVLLCRQKSRRKYFMTFFYV